MTLIMNLQNLQQENGTLLMTKIMNNMAEENDSTIQFETKVIKPSLCDYSDAYILVTGNIKLQMLLQILTLHLKIVLLLQDV